MRLPQKKKPGDPIMAEDWNLLLDAIAARTPRPGDGLKFISSSGGFAYAMPPPAAHRPGQPPFSVIAGGMFGESRGVVLQEGWVIERIPNTGSDPVVRFHIPTLDGTPLNAIPKPVVTVAVNETVYCTYKTDRKGIIQEGTVKIVTGADGMNGPHYQPVHPEGYGAEGEYFVKLLRLGMDGWTVFQQSDIEHWAPLWTGVNTGGGEGRVYKKHEESENIYMFRTIRAGSNITVTQTDGEIVISTYPGWPEIPSGEDGSLAFLDCEEIPLEDKKIEWEGGLVKTAGDITVKVPPCPPYGQEAVWYGGAGITGATGELIIRSDRPDLTYPDNIVGYVKAENGIVTEIRGDVLVCCHPSAP